MSEIEAPSRPPPDLARLHQTSSPTVPTKLTSDDTSQNQSSKTPGVLRRQLHEQGYIHIPKLLPPHLLLAAQATSKYLVSRTRTGTFWPYVRTVPKQYPPWPELNLKAPNPDLNIWGVQHLLHPNLTSLRDVYAEIYFSEEVIGVVRELLGEPDDTTTESSGQDRAAVSDEDLVMELFNLLCSPTKSHDFELAWHRDDVRPDVSPDIEEHELRTKTPGGRQLHAQYNIALFDDESLIVISGSHRRVRTQQERDATPYQTGLESEIVVKLQPGDAVFYDSNILHRGVYKGIDEKNELGRMTLHGSVGLKGYGNERSRQVLQHGVGTWIEKEEAKFSNVQDEGKKRRAETMRQALVDMGRGRDDVGYSLEG
ncbi:hypothetical protein LTR64_005490 [Lithohypha guttulata]|uniref:uncharacterized protein n=1 Tax=Lithohypha guttulata TaxID=1690604 RepID=UPI002DDECBDA|nr:hypothetical protein LTR51_002718 [Lithohypha guttulata]